MITSNIYDRVYRIRYGLNAGTAFTISYENREYIITAKHIVKDIKKNDFLKIFANNEWKNLEVKLIGHSILDSDISVLTAVSIISKRNFPLPASVEGIILSQDVYYLGYPYGFTGQFIIGDEGYPWPFVKKAIISYLDFPVILLDGFNNPGFSGGPVVFSLPGKFDYKVCGVISGYKSAEESILENGKNSNYSFEFNTGIIISYGINLAIDIIKENPIGTLI